jgi:hypothetical protein
MAAGPITDFNGNEIIGAPTVQRLMGALEAVSNRHLFSLYDTAHAVLALEDGTEKEGLLLKLAAEALYYSNNLREEREAEQCRTVTLTPETHGAHVVRFDPGVRSVETTEPGGVVTVTSIEDVAFKEPPVTAWICVACHRACESASKYPMCACGTLASGETAP